MKPALFATALASLFTACAGDLHTTEQSPTQPARSATSRETRTSGTATSSFMQGRVYQVTRLETADTKRAEWRTLGQTIRQNGSTIEFIELGSGKTVSFTGPHQITPTSSKTDRVSIQGPSDDPGQVRNEAPAAPVR